MFRKPSRFPKHTLFTLQRTAKMTIASEKSRSEWIAAPILMEVKYLNTDKMNILSGENLRFKGFKPIFWF
jgi:hypothetical protein